MEKFPEYWAQSLELVQIMLHQRKTTISLYVEETPDHIYLILFDFAIRHEVHMTLPEYCAKFLPSLTSTNVT